MTDEEFDKIFTSMEVIDFWKYIVEHMRIITFKNGNGYLIESEEDLEAAVYQHMYERLTGRT